MRLSLNMNYRECIIELAEGNPGALDCMIQLLRHDYVRGGMAIAGLDVLGLYGESIYLAWNDACNRDPETMIEMVMDGSAAEAVAVYRVFTALRNLSFQMMREAA